MSFIKVVHKEQVLFLDLYSLQKTDSMFGSWIRLSPDPVLYSNTGMISVARAGDRDQWIFPLSFLFFPPWQRLHLLLGAVPICLMELSSSPTLTPLGEKLLNFVWDWSHLPLQSCPSYQWQDRHHSQRDCQPMAEPLKRGCLMAKIAITSC